MVLLSERLQRSARGVFLFDQDLEGMCKQFNGILVRRALLRGLFVLVVNKGRNFEGCLLETVRLLSNFELVGGFASLGDAVR